MAHVPSDTVFDRKYVDDFLRSEPLKSFDPSQISVDIVSRINSILGTNAPMVGGPIRDEFNSETPNDYDVHVGMFETEAFRSMPRSACDEDVLRVLSGKIAVNEDFKQASDLVFTDLNDRVFGNVSFDFKGARVDVAFKPDQVGLTSAMYGYSTITSAALTVDEDGEATTLVHPLFVQHNEEGVHAIRVTGEYDLMRSNEIIAQKTGRQADYRILQPYEYLEELRADGW